MKNNFFAFRWIIFLIFFATSASLLIGRKVGNTSFYILILLALITLVLKMKPIEQSFSSFVRKNWKFHLAMAGMLTAILLNQVFSLDFAARSYDYPSRMGLFVLIAWMALFCSVPMFKHLQWSYVLGAILATAKMYIITDGGTTRTQYTDFMPIIEFADMALLLGFFSLLSIRYDGFVTRRAKATAALKFLVFIGTLYAAYISQTRGTWLAIPFLIIVGIAILFKGSQLGRKLLLSISVLALLGVMFGLSPIVQERINDARKDIQLYSKDTASDTSIGTRYELWKTSIGLFSKHPLIGIGRENFHPTLERLGQEKQITPVIARQIHSHNEIFYNMATLGSFGLIGILALYLVPALHFFRKMKSEDDIIRATAGMGAALSIGFLIFGLTDVMFMWGASDNFYVIFVAIFFAHIYKRERELVGTT